MLLLSPSFTWLTCLFRLDLTLFIVREKYQLWELPYILGSDPRKRSSTYLYIRFIRGKLVCQSVKLYGMRIYLRALDACLRHSCRPKWNTIQCNNFYIDDDCIRCISNYNEYIWVSVGGKCECVVEVNFSSLFHCSASASLDKME